MSQINALDIQEFLKGVDTVSVPVIQKNFNLGYQDARMFLEQLILRGWVAENSEGIHYKVQKAHLCLRKIKRDEVVELVKALNSNCIVVLNCIGKKHPTGATMSDLSAALKDEEDARTAVRVLKEHKLIFCVNDRYFSCVSHRTMEIISSAIKMKRSCDMRRRMSDDIPDYSEVYMLFSELFTED